MRISNPKPEDAKELRPVHLFIAEDDRQEAHKIRRAFRNVVNEITVVLGPKRARDYLLNSEDAFNGDVPNVVILSVDMMEEGCWEVLKEIRSREEFQDSILIGISGDLSFQQGERARKAGVDVFLPRPVRTNVLNELAAKVDKFGLALVHKIHNGEATS